MKSILILQSILILFLVLPLKNAQQTNTTLQNDSKGLKTVAESKNETAEIKIDPIKKEMREFMRDCGVDVPEIEEDPEANIEAVKGIDKTTNTNKLGNLNMAPMISDNLNDGRNKKNKNKGTYPTSYGNNDKKRKNKKRPGNNDCDDDIDDSCEDEDDDRDDDGSDEDEDDRRRGKDKKKGNGGRRDRNRRDMSTLVEQFNTTGQAVDGADTEMNEDFKNKKNKRPGGNKRGGNRDYDDDDDEEDDDDDGGNRCGRGKNKGGRGGGKGKNRGGQGGGGKKNKGGRGGNKGSKKHGGGGDDFGGGDGGGSHGGSPFDTGVGGMGPGMGDHYGYPGLSASGYYNGNPYGYGGYSGYVRQLGDSELISRIKRQEDKIECASQCVFGYMEILDDNRVPSETALISYYQEKITNNQKKSETIRNVRRCFARLVATDTEDGCEFSKSVSKCLNLDLDP